MIDGPDDDRVMELAYRAMGKTAAQAERAIEGKKTDMDQALFNQYACNFETYSHIIDDLLKFTPLCVSPLSGTIFHAFVDVDKSMAIVKRPADKALQQRERDRIKQKEERIASPTGR